MGTRRTAARGLVLGLAAIATLLWIRVFPIYFRADDARWLEWAAGHDNPLTAFVPAQATVIDVFRPVQNLAWWVLFRIFGLQPAPYQFVLTALFLVCLALLGRVSGRIFASSAGWWSVAALLVMFPFLASVVLWFSDLSFLVETTFMLMAIGSVATFIAGRASFGWAALAFVVAVLAREPAVVIVPSVAVALLNASWPDMAPAQRRRAALGVGGLAAVGVLIVLVHPSLAARQGVGFGDLAANLGFFAQRWRFYSASALSGAGALAVALALVSVWRTVVPTGGAIARTYAPLAVSLGVAALLRGFPSVATAAIVASVAVHLVLRRKEAAAGVWFAVPLLGLLAISFAVRTYLFEAAFGLALFAGAVVAELARELRNDARQTPVGGRRAAGAVVLAALIVIGYRAGPKVRQYVDAVSAVSAARENFRAMVETLLDRSFSSSTVVVVEYADMGLDEVRDIQPLSDPEKARRQKTMASPELRELLRLGGRPDHTIITLGELLRRPSGSSGLLLVMSRFEEEFVTRCPLRCNVVAEAERNGEIARLESCTAIHL